MLHSSKNLYLIKIDDNEKYGLVSSGIADIQYLIDLGENVRNKYLIAKKVDGKYLLLNKTIHGKEIYVGTKLVKVVKERRLIEILSNPKKFYSNKQLAEIEGWINKVREDFKESTIINGEITRRA